MREFYAKHYNVKANLGLNVGGNASAKKELLRIEQNIGLYVTEYMFILRNKIK